MHVSIIQYLHIHIHIHITYKPSPVGQLMIVCTTIRSNLGMLAQITWGATRVSAKTIGNQGDSLDSRGSIQDLTMGIVMDFSR